MPVSTIIIEKPWSYVVFMNGDEPMLTLMAGGVMELDYTIRLGEDEMLGIREQPDSVAELVQSLLNDRVALVSRALAVAVWPGK